MKHLHRARVSFCAQSLTLKIACSLRGGTGICTVLHVYLTCCMVHVHVVLRTVVETNIYTLGRPKQHCQVGLRYMTDLSTLNPSATNPSMQLHKYIHVYGHMQCCLTHYPLMATFMAKLFFLCRIGKFNTCTFTTLILKNLHHWFVFISNFSTYMYMYQVFSGPCKSQCIVFNWKALILISPHFS